MENETEKIFTEQLGKLPQEVVTFISSTSWDTDLDEIGELYNLSTEEILAFKREVTLVLAGLIHPDALTQMLEQEVGIKGAVLEAIVANVEKKIFSTIRPALITFFEKETLEHADENSAQGSPLTPNTLNLKPSFAPDNLPTDLIEIEPATPSVVPPVPLSNVNSQMSNVPHFVPPTSSHLTPAPPAHPFEEKMKRVFTAGQQNMNELIIKTPEPQSVVTSQLSSIPPVSPSVVSGQSSVVPPVPSAPSSVVPPTVPHSDPYREPIE